MLHLLKMPCLQKPTFVSLTNYYAKVNTPLIKTQASWLPRNKNITSPTRNNRKLKTASKKCWNNVMTANTFSMFQKQYHFSTLTKSATQLSLHLNSLDTLLHLLRQPIAFDRTFGELSASFWLCITQHLVTQRYGTSRAGQGKARHGN